MTFTICEGQVGAYSTRLGDPLPTEQCIAAPSATGTTEKNTGQLAKRAQKRAQLTIELWWDNVLKGDQIGEQGGQRCI